MSLIQPLLCFICSFITCLHVCQAAPLTVSCSKSQCRRSTVNPLQINLRTLGTVLGTNTGCGAQRFTLPYAQPPLGDLRFASPQPLTWIANATSNATLGVYDATRLPKACMQEPDSRYGISAQGISEDCLYLNIFRPSAGSNPSQPLPVMVWIHGGSFISGSSTAPGLDASYLATRHNAIVVTIQYRLGIFGFFSPTQFTSQSTGSSATTGRSINGNQGVQDVIAALAFVKCNIAGFNGDPDSITIAGQSSGAHMIRSLLDSDPASPLFARAIMHSDPADFGSQSLHTASLVSNYALQQTPCSDLGCLRNLDAQDLLGVSMATVQAGQAIDASVAVSEVWRPFAGELTDVTFESNPGTSLAAKSGKQIIYTNVENEGGSAVGQMLLPTGVDASSAQLQAYPVTLTRAQLLQQMFNAGRGQTLSSAAQYGMNTANTSAYPAPAKIQRFSQANDSLRANLEMILTQGMFVCPTWGNAQRYPQAYVAVFEKGISYPSNAGNDYCANRVCHEDDILLVFSDPNTVDVGVKNTVQEVQARWMAFVKSGNPNTATYRGWTTVGNSKQEAQVLRLGAYAGAKTQASLLDTVSLQAGQYAGCGQVWGGEVQFDWQLYQ